MSVQSVDETTAYRQEMSDCAAEALWRLQVARQYYSTFMDRYSDRGNSVVDEVELAAKTLWEI